MPIPAAGRFIRREGLKTQSERIYRSEDIRRGALAKGATCGFARQRCVMETSKEVLRLKLEKRVMDACMDLAAMDANHGCLFAIELKRQAHHYYVKVFPSLYHENGKRLNVLDSHDRQVIAHLATVDGATIVDARGNLEEFGVTLTRQQTFLSHGKRHAFALGTSRRKGVVCVLASEEDKHVRVFRDGMCVVDMDSRTRIPETIRHKVIDLLDTPLSKVLIASGIATSILTLNPIPAIVTITGSTVIVSYGFDRLKKLFSLRPEIHRRGKHKEDGR